MKKLYLNLLLLLFIVSSAVAQNVKYYRVQIFTNDAGLQRLAAAGVGFDHGEYKKDAWFISEFSGNELNIIKQSGYPYKVLISDMSAYYVSRNNIAETEPTEDQPLSCSTYAIPANFKYGSMVGFYTYKEMLAALDSMKLKFPNLITLRKRVSSSTTAEGRPLYYVKISDHPGIDENEPEILYTALHHAREPESVTQLIFYMWYLLENYTKDPFIKSLVDSTEMYFIPCVNPDGYIYNQSTNPQGGGLWRKNRRDNGSGSYGVDLNRNYGYKWAYDNSGSSPYKWDETYRGPGAFSEPETQMVRDFCRTHSFYFSLNHHTYANALIFPYGYKANTYTPDSALYRQYATRLAQCNSFITGTVNQTLGYLANGDSNDWMYGDQTSKTKIFALTPETGNSIDGFWPRKSRIIPLAQANVDMNLTAARFTKESVYTASIVSTLQNAVVTEKETIAMLKSAPNPCNTYTYITYKAGNNINTKNLYLKIFDASGALMQATKINTAQSKVFVNTSSLKSGVYFYFISDGQNKSGVEKLIVVR